MRLTRSSLRAALTGTSAPTPPAGQMPTLTPQRASGPPPPAGQPRMMPRPPSPPAPSPAEIALRTQLGLLRLMRTSEGHRELQRRLRQSEAARAALDARLAEMQRENESLYRELKAAQAALSEAGVRE